MTTGAEINLRVHCQMEGCQCDSVVPARVIVRSAGDRLYEHTNRCPTCGHKLKKHRAVFNGEVVENNLRA